MSRLKTKLLFSRFHLVSCLLLQTLLHTLSLLPSFPPSLLPFFSSVASCQDYSHSNQKRYLTQFLMRWSHPSIDFVNCFPTSHTPFISQAFEARKWQASVATCINLRCLDTVCHEFRMISSYCLIPANIRSIILPHLETKKQSSCELRVLLRITN